jgi:hypothetical protein
MSNEETEKSKGGRPTKLSSVDMRLLKYMARHGATDEEIAEAFEVHVQTVYNWKKKNPEFFAKLSAWKEEADEKVERKLYERATGYDCKETKLFCHEGMIVAEDIVKHHPPDTTAMIFWLKNRKPKEWRDRVENANINIEKEKTLEEYLKSLESTDGQETSKA